jgi:hypothetical protein
MHRDLSLLDLDRTFSHEQMQRQLMTKMGQIEDAIVRREHSLVKEIERLKNVRDVPDEPIKAKAPWPVLFVLSTAPHVSVSRFHSVLLVSATCINIADPIFCYSPCMILFFVKCSRRCIKNEWGLITVAMAIVFEHLDRSFKFEHDGIVLIILMHKGVVTHPSHTSSHSLTPPAQHTSHAQMKAVADMLEIDLHERKAKPPIQPAANGRDQHEVAI